MAREKRLNRLQSESSPYLLQHAANPVDWFPWGEEAFEKARREDKPVFLSIGYSTCHWCHVMERESFEDEQVAALMNEHFVCVKVDREERPDVDAAYMAVCRMMSASCGWPLNVILTPEKLPFFVTTYIPRESRFGRAGMMELVPALGRAWKDRRAEVLRSARRITDVLAESPEEAGGSEPGLETLEAAFEQLESLFDGEYGGFGREPKFPAPHNLLFLLRYWKRSGESKALAMVESTLEAMRLGGLWDHVGYGFHRYSTDRRWLLPHFEKMLYDQALAAMAYTEAYQATGKAFYRRTAEEIFEYVLRDMTSEEGAFFSAEDADSEGEEGKFYLWTEADLKETLGDEEAELVACLFNVGSEGNFRDEAGGTPTGANILHLAEPLPKSASRLGVSVGELSKRLEVVLQRLFEARKKRVRPHKDDKILADWNGLMIAALAKGAAAFDKPEYAESAARAAEFVLSRMRNTDGRLVHSHRADRAGSGAIAADYAFIIWGLFELYESLFDAGHLQTSLGLNEEFLQQFWDNEAGGFFFTPGDGEKLIVRQKEIYDGAIPSANSVAMLNLLRLARVTADHKLEAKAASLARAFAGSVNRAPAAYTQFLSTLDFALGPNLEVVIAGDLNSSDTRKLLAAVRRSYEPNVVVVLKHEGAEPRQGLGFGEYAAAMKAIDGKAAAYVCRDFLCEQPTTDPRQLRREVAELRLRDKT
jgi:uncharacterized protein YyaL (SSP411 family)